MPAVLEALAEAAEAGDPRAIARAVGLVVEEFRDLCREDYRAFIRYCLGYQLAPFHERWFEHQLRHNRTLILAPRGHGKTSICTIAYALWAIVRNPNVRILLLSKTAQQAQMILAEIRSHLEQNRMLRAAFGDMATPDMWSATRLTVKRTRIMKEPTVTALGAGSSIPARHVDMILADDLCDMWNTVTPKAREDLWRWWEQTVVPTLEPDGEAHVIGTRWHEDDLYGRLLAVSERAEPGAGYAVLVDRAVIREGPTPADWEVLWPERFPPEQLKALRDEMGPVAFALQYQCSVELGSIQGAVFDRGKFVVVPDTEARRLAQTAQFVAQAWDLAVGKDAIGTEPGGGHYSACVTVALLADGRFLVLDWWRGKPTLAGQISEIQKQAAKWEPDVIGVEAVAYQAALAQHMVRTTTLPVVPLVPDRDKTRRAWAVQPYVEAGRVLVAASISQLIDILAAFPFGEEDDSVDAFVYAMQLAARRERAGKPYVHRSL